MSPSSPCNPRKRLTPRLRRICLPAGMVHIPRKDRTAQAQQQQKDQAQKPTPTKPDTP